MIAMDHLFWNRNTEVKITQLPLTRTTNPTISLVASKASLVIIFKTTKPHYDQDHQRPGVTNIKLISLGQDLLRKLWCSPAPIWTPYSGEEKKDKTGNPSFDFNKFLLENVIRSLRGEWQILYLFYFIFLIRRS